MASLTADGGDLCLHYSTGTFSHKYTSGSGSIVTETLAPFASEPVLQPSLAVHALTASASIVYGAAKLLLTNQSPNSVFYFRTDPTGTQSIGLFAIGGTLCLFKGNFSNPTIGGSIATAPALILDNVYYTFELAVKCAFAGSASVEVRLNNVRVPQLTSTDYTASGGQPAGTLTQSTLDTALNVANDPIRDFSLGSSKRVAWWVVKRGTSLWKSIATGATTYADATDFVGDRKRAFLRCTGVGNYTVAGGNWDNGAGTFPTNLADASGSFSATDSDTSYVNNTTAPVTAGSPLSADKLSMDYENLPGTATSVGFVQRVVHARSNLSTQAQLQTFRRSGGTDYADTDVMSLIDGAYRFKQIPHDTPANSSNSWTPTTVNAVEGGLACYALA